jgi:hypothetical protein
MCSDGDPLPGAEVVDDPPREAVEGDDVDPVEERPDDTGGVQKGELRCGRSPPKLP